MVEAVVIVGSERRWGVMEAAAFEGSTLVWGTTWRWRSRSWALAVGLGTWDRRGLVRVCLWVEILGRS